MIEIGIDELSSFAADGVGEVREGRSQASHHLDRIPAILADFVEREREIIAPAWHLEHDPQGAVCVEGAGRLEVAFCQPHQQILDLIDGLDSGRRIVDRGREGLDGDVDQKPQRIFGILLQGPLIPDADALPQFRF